MTDAGQCRGLLEYNQWADERILNAIEGLGDAELTHPREVYFGSIAQNLRHIVIAQMRWLARWTGGPLPPADHLLGPWREAYGASHAALRQYVTPMVDADFERIVSFKRLDGSPNRQPLGQLITHLVNHGTAHRAETGLLLERIGRSPGDLDYIVFLHERGR